MDKITRAWINIHFTVSHKHRKLSGVMVRVADCWTNDLAGPHPLVQSVKFSYFFCWIHLIRRVLWRKKFKRKFTKILQFIIPFCTFNLVITKCHWRVWYPLGIMFLPGGMMSLPVWSHVPSGMSTASRGRVLVPERSGPGGSGYLPWYWHLMVATAVVSMHPTGMHSCLQLQL